MKNISQIFSQRQAGDAKPLFIFEMANNHMGDVNHGLKIIRDVHSVSKDFDFNFAFKFQYRDLDTFIHPDYKDRMDLKYIKRFSETRLKEEEFLTLKNEVEKLGFISICTPFDEASVEKIVKHNYDIIKIASASFTDWPLLEKIVSCDKPIIASTGGVKIENIDKVVNFFSHRNKQFAVMHCVGQYPTEDGQLQFNQITLLRDRYPEITIGFSTHERPDNFEAVKLAVAKGAGILEKHVSIKTEQYPINAYSATPDQLRNWLEAARQAYKICGVVGRRHEFNSAESADIRQFQRGVFAGRDIKAGERIDVTNTFFAFPNKDGQILANDMSKYTVLTAQKDFKKNDPIMASELSILEVREKVYEVLKKVNEILKKAGVPISNKWDFELSHHYGLDKFHDIGASIVSCFNREYCKKLIVMLPGQKHPTHTHKLKEETFHVLWGDVTFGVGSNKQTCGPGDILTIERGCNHDFESNGGCVFEEISTTHYKNDSFYEDQDIINNPNRKTILTYWVI
ncbi:MAG: N-acetylneuraminate synthase family protein [Candidatus Magasanikbacteria bacterium]